MKILKLNKSDIDDLFSKKEKEDIFFDENISENDLIESLKYIFDVQEKEYKEGHEISNNINLKGLCFEKLLCGFKTFINRESLVDCNAILNLINLIRGYNTFSDEFFESKEIFVSDIEQMIDIKLELEKEIKILSYNLMIWYLSIITSAHKLVVTIHDNITDIPNIYHFIIGSMDFISLSSISKSVMEKVIEDKSFNFNFSDLKNVKDASVYIINLSNGIVISDKFMSLMIKEEKSE